MENTKNTPRNLRCQYEFLGAAISASLNLSAFILVIEWLPAKYRLYASAAVPLLVSTGEIMSGILAILFPHYRTYLLIVYAPGLVVLAYLWILPESTRWLHASGRHARAMKIIKRTAKQNKRHISDRSLEILMGRPAEADDGGAVEPERSAGFRDFFRYRKMVFRLLVCAAVWCLMCFLYYGIGIRATKFQGDDNKVKVDGICMTTTHIKIYSSGGVEKNVADLDAILIRFSGCNWSELQYLTYLTTVSAEVPAAFASFFILKCVGRKTAIVVTSLTASTALIASCFIPPHWTTLIRLCFALSMMAMASVSAVLCVFSAELWPTPIRSTLMTTCSMVGRIGPMAAPILIVLLVCPVVIL